MQQSAIRDVNKWTQDAECDKWMKSIISNNIETDKWITESNKLCMQMLSHRLTEHWAADIWTLNTHCKMLHRGLSLWWNKLNTSTTILILTLKIKDTF
jgi:hypothetical protein